MLFELKKYRGVVFHDIRVMQCLRKNWHVVWKMTWGIWQISPEHSKMSKLELWWDPFVQIRKCMSLKLTEELCIMTMNNDTKIEEELTWVTSRVLTRALESLRNLYFNWLLVTKIYNAWATKVQRSYLLCHWRVMQILKKNWLLVWKMKWEIWQIFTRALKSVKIETSMGFFCPK